MSRAVRRVPENWSHPKVNGIYKPLLSDYVGYLKYYKDNVHEFINHMTEVIEKGSTIIYETVYTDSTKVYRYLVSDDNLKQPILSRFMPKGEWYQLYEEVSEGTPITPPFRTKKELKKYLMTSGTFWDSSPWPENRAEGMVKSGYAMSGIFTNGKIYKAEEAFDIEK